MGGIRLIVERPVHRRRRLAGEDRHHASQLARSITAVFGAPGE